MTTILGIEHKNGFVVAADSQTTDRERPFYHPDIKKIIEVGNYVIAGAGQSSLIDIYQGGYSPVEMTEGFTGNIYQFITSKFIPELRQLHVDSGYVAKKTNDFEFIVGYKNKLFYIASDYSVLKSKDGFYAVGSGYAYGLGALATGINIKQAIKIASRFDVNTGGAIQLVTRGGQDA
jgi:ATP-dependent protease HslVU (ClpYQ) peptidase subunit